MNVLITFVAQRRDFGNFEGVHLKCDSTCSDVVEGSVRLDIFQKAF